MKFKLLTTAIALLITQSAFAAETMQIQCPSVDVLSVSTAVSREINNDVLWYGVEWKNKFNTKREWTLVAGPVKNVSTDSEAITGANYALPKMIYSGKEMKGIYTLCFYDYDSFGGAVAITPARSPNELLTFLRR